jgi:hypothetical protein
VSINDREDLIQLGSAEAVIVRKLNGFKPELARHSFSANLNMGRFVAVQAVEIEAEAWGRRCNSTAIGTLK